MGHSPERHRSIIRRHLLVVANQPGFRRRLQRHCFTQRGVLADIIHNIDFLCRPEADTWPGTALPSLDSRKVGIADQHRSCVLSSRYIRLHVLPPCGCRHTRDDELEYCHVRCRHHILNGILYDTCPSPICRTCDVGQGSPADGLILKRLCHLAGKIC